MKTLKNLLLASILFAFVACSEEDVLNNTQLITQRTWTYDSVEGFSSDWTAFYDLFLTGATWKFNSDGTTTISSAGSSSSGTWEFNSDETQLILDPGTADEESFTIVTLTATSLVIQGEDDLATDGTYTLHLK